MELLRRAERVSTFLLFRHFPCICLQFSLYQRHNVSTPILVYQVALAAIFTSTAWSLDTAIKLIGAERGVVVYFISVRAHELDFLYLLPFQLCLLLLPI